MRAWGGEYCFLHNRLLNCRDLKLGVWLTKDCWTAVTLILQIVLEKLGAMKIGMVI